MGLNLAAINPPTQFFADMFNWYQILGKQWSLHANKVLCLQEVNRFTCISWWFLNMGTTYKYIKISSLYTFCISMHLMTGNKSVVDTCYWRNTTDNTITPHQFPEFFQHTPSPPSACLCCCWTSNGYASPSTNFNITEVHVVFFVLIHAHYQCIRTEKRLYSFAFECC